MTSEHTAIINPFEQPGQWYKANFHTHSTVSDGNVPPEERVRQYKEKGYSILALTDHVKTNDVKKWTTKDFLVLSGMEIHPPSPLPGDCFHLVCLNVPLDFTLPDELDANARIERVKQAGGEVIYGHPYWCGHNINHALLLKGYLAVEVFNATCSNIGKGFSSVHWDDMLMHHINIPAVAVDDCHSNGDLFKGWTMIKAKDLTVPSVMQALRTGSFYASCGPEIKNCQIRDKKLIIECSPVAEIHFMGQMANGISNYAPAGQEFTSAYFDLNDNLQYLRVEVVDRQGKRAWINPFIFQK
jgi:hypothetical protein